MMLGLPDRWLPPRGCGALATVLALAVSPALLAQAPPRLAPRPDSPPPVSTHAPFAAGECKLCHQSADPKRPGPVSKPSPGLCLDCHDEFAQVLGRPHTHAPARQDCMLCHNPHNAAQPKLLLGEPRAVCGECHANVVALDQKAKVKHAAMSAPGQCSNCHNAHGSAVARLLVALPFDLCVNCHNRDGRLDASGRKLQNIKAWLDANKVWHGPVADKDCSACHAAHGSDQFRLLTANYPPEFYAPYDVRNYALCFGCHNEKAYSTPQTTTLTNFRDGARNLHYVHLQQGARGRTCRACHEVHASSQAHHIRDGVPYGTSGWILKINFTKAADGGTCDKTCHTKKTYSSRATP